MNKEFRQEIGIPKPLGVRLLAYYLPQFHQTRENDEWHGVGFTEWTKVKAAKRLYIGHRQPRIPHEDLGYYDLSEPGVLNKQAEMLKRSGLSGFIFYHYRFGEGRKLLDGPVDELLGNQEIDVEYCLAWCNENWTRRWDGGNQEILMEQKYSAQDAIEFITELIPHFRDERYIKVDGKPVLIIYRPHLVPNLREYVEIWKGICVENEVPYPYLVASETWGGQDFADGLQIFNAVSEKPMYDWPLLGHLKRPDIEYIDGEHEGFILNYDNVADYYMDNPAQSHTRIIPSLNPGWDVTPRHGKKALILHAESPEKFGEWLQNSIMRAATTENPSERFVFINAWNEWAEGTYLEPDSHAGYEYLNEIAKRTKGIHE